MHARAALWGDALAPREPGAVALVSQSGNVAVNALATRRGLRFHTVIASGNQAVLSAADYLEYLAAQDGVALDRAVPRGRRRPAAVRRACRVRRGGRPRRGAEGRQLAAPAPVPRPRTARRSPATSACSGRSSTEAGAVWADDVHELLELAKTLAVAPRRAPARGRGLAIMTCSGGDSAQGADEAARCGLTLPRSRASTRARLRELLPTAATVANPLDYTAMIWGEREALARARADRRRGPGDRPGARLLRPAPRARRARPRSPGARFARASSAARRRSPVPTIVSSTLPELLDDAAAWRFAQAGVAAAAGLRTGLRCAGGD